ncbi:hypothetical protein ABI59_01750 [Acidobacteria bacterium Mor1]|nr:hypothetical protein ABI59_01750 [Acidobacteria bacterium Mor1]
MHRTGTGRPGAQRTAGARCHSLGEGSLSLLSWTYAGLMRWRNRRYDRPERVTRVGVPVLSVGNLSVGGTGKTPMVCWIVRLLAERGHRPAVVSRGYRGKAGKGPLRVSDAEGIHSTAEIAGDEPYMLARMLPGVPVVVGSDRIAGAREAIAAGADGIVLDDGFQHRRLGRDLDIVLLDANKPFGNGRVLPAGTLREPPEGLSRAGVIVLTRSEQAPSPGLLSRIATLAPGVPCLTSRHRSAGLVDAAGREVEAPARALAFCGIAQPAAFRRSLEQAGVDLVSFHDYPDHHAYRDAELEALARSCRELDVPAITTEKDRARMTKAMGLFPEGQPLALRIEIAFEDDTPLRRALERSMGAPR